MAEYRRPDGPAEKSDEKDYPPVNSASLAQRQDGVFKIGLFGWPAFCDPPATLPI
jgi:hypothetical protein